MRPLAALALRGRFDVVRATNRATGAPLPLIPPARGAVETELRRDRVGFLADARLGAEVERIAASTRAAPAEVRASAYTLLHLDAGATLPGVRGRALRVDLRVRNALDARYRDFLSRYKTFAYDPGRNVVLRVSTGL